MKFRQFKSAVCDAFGVFCFGGGLAWGVVLLGGCRVFGYLIYYFGGFN